MFRRILAIVVLSAGAVTSASPAAAQSARELDEADMRNAPVLEPHITLAAVVPGDFYFSTNLYHFVPDMSGDGNWLVYPSRVASTSGEAADLYRKSMVTGVAERINAGGLASDPAVSDDGRVVVYNWSENEFRTSRIRRWIAGVGSTDLIAVGAAGYYRKPTVSDDGSTATWLSREPEEENHITVWNGEAYTSTLSGSSPDEDTALPIATDAKTVSGNGRYVFHVDWERREVRWDLSTGEVIEVGDAGQVSDDGEWIAGSGPYLGDYNLGSAATLYRAGGGAELTVWHPYFETSVVLPPTLLSGDGSTMLLGDGALHIEFGFGHSYHLVDVGTATAQRVVLPFNAHPIGLSDDGSRALMLEDDFNGRYRLWLVDFDTTAAPTVFTDQLAQPQLTHQIRRLYRAILNRNPNSDELLYWLRQRAGGASLPWIADQIIGSDGYQERFGTPTDADLIQLLMDHVYMNEDPGEYHERLLAGESQGQIAARISEHPLAIWGFEDPWSWPPFPKDNQSWPSPPEAAQIWRLYQAYFLRAAEQEGLNYWLDLYWTGTPLPTVSDYMAVSPEFERRYGSLTDPEFVDRIYLNVLGRPAEAAGKTYWVGQLAAGLTRGEMMIGFSDSPEFIRTTDSIPPGG